MARDSRFSHTMGIGMISSTVLIFTIFLKEDFVKVFSQRVHVHDNANELSVENANELKSWVQRVKS